MMHMKCLWAGFVVSMETLLVDAEKETLSVLDKLFSTVKRRRKFHGELHWQGAYSVLFSVSYSGMARASVFI